MDNGFVTGRRFRNHRSPSVGWSFLGVWLLGLLMPTPLPGGEPVAFRPPAPMRADGVPPRLGAVAGERLRFNLHWMGVPAGMAVLKREPAPAGRYLLEVEVASVALVALLHPIEDRMRAKGILTGDGFRAERYDKDQRRGRKEKRTVYHFKRPENKVVRVRNGTVVLEMAEAPATVNDPVSGFYDLRARPRLNEGFEMAWPLADGKKIYRVTLAVGAVDRINTPLGWFRAFPVRVAVSGSKLFGEKGSITIWLTDDERRLPVQLLSWVKFGKIAADLVAYDDGRGEQRQVDWEEE